MNRPVICNWVQLSHNDVRQQLQPGVPGVVVWADDGVCVEHVSYDDGAEHPADANMQEWELPDVYYLHQNSIW